MFKIFVIAAVFAGSYVTAHPTDADAQIHSSSNEQYPDGSYSYKFDTTNGISMHESGVGGHYAKGSYQYYSPEGELIKISYTADENGFHPYGAHLPTPPPVPEHNLHTLQYTNSYPHYVEQPQYHHQQQHNYQNVYLGKY